MTKIPKSLSGARDVAPDPVHKTPDATAGLQPVRWAELGPEQRQAYLERTFTEYGKLLNELIDASNGCVEKYAEFTKAHVIWRWTVIIGTGTIALLNIIGTWIHVHFGQLTIPGGDRLFADSFGIVTSVFGVVVTIVATLEGFSNSAERAQGFRESREMFLDTSREFTAAWETYVGPLSDTAEACQNACELNRRLIQADRDLRSRFKDLTMAHQKHGGEA
jgi:hypothetical protein